MPIVTGTIDQDGAVVGVLVGVSRNRQTRLESVGFAVPQRVALRLQIDTGSFVTAFLPTVFQSLGLTPFQIIPVRTPSTSPGRPHLAQQFDVSLTLVSGMDQTLLPSVHAIASDDFDTEEGYRASSAATFSTAASSITTGRIGPSRSPSDRVNRDVASLLAFHAVGWPKWRGLGFRS